MLATGDAGDTGDTGVQADLPGLERAAVEPIARRALGRETAKVGGWRVEIVEAGMGAATGGIYRVAGSAPDGGLQVPWSAILKVVSLDTAGSQAAFEDEAHPLYWKREALAYTSGLLDDLPGGVRAPRCYGVVEVDEGCTWLWLEEVKDEGTTAWGLEQYARAAECLGRFNGAYLAGHSAPEYPWLVRSGSPRGLLAHNAWIRDIVADPGTWQHPLMRAAFPVPVVERLLRLWDGREGLLTELDRVPHTFCHLDAWRRNMFATLDDGGSPGLTLIDWAYPGFAAAGTDAGDLFGESFCLLELGDTDPGMLDQAIFESYAAGLEEAGWKGDVSAVRFAFTAFCALKHLFLIFVSLRDVPDEVRHGVWERLFGRTFRDYVERQAVHLYYLLERAEEALSLMSRKPEMFHVKQ